MDRWRNFYYNQGEPLKDHHFKVGHYRRLEPITELKDYKINPNIPLDTDLKLALEGVPIDEE